MSGKLWIYWATTVPATIVIVVLWELWLANSDAIIKFLKGSQRWPSTLWEKVKPSQSPARETIAQP